MSNKCGKRLPMWALFIHAFYLAHNYNIYLIGRKEEEKKRTKKNQRNQEYEPPTKY